jgi:hypothetical protein
MPAHKRRSNHNPHAKQDYRQNLHEQREILPGIRNGRLPERKIRKICV